MSKHLNEDSITTFDDFELKGMKMVVPKDMKINVYEYDKNLKVARNNKVDELLPKGDYEIYSVLSNSSGNFVIAKGKKDKKYYSLKREDLMKIKEIEIL